jgi:hypothetical protein
MDGWRNEHLSELAKDDACGTALAALMTGVYTADVPTKMADILSFATLVVLLKKDATTMEEMKERLGPAYVQPQRPIGMEMAIGKVACNYALLLVKEATGPAVSPKQFPVETKGGCALLQWAIQMALEMKPNLAAANMDNINAYGNIERDCI